MVTKDEIQDLLNRVTAYDGNGSVGAMEELFAECGGMLQRLAEEKGEEKNWLEQVAIRDAMLEDLTGAVGNLLNALDTEDLELAEFVEQARHKLANIKAAKP